jgi:hypothetical protein
MTAKALLRVMVGGMFMAGSQMSRAAVTVTVPGTANPWLAGMPDGSIAGQGPSIDPGQDIAPAESPVAVTGIPIDPGGILEFYISGLESHDPADTNPPLYGPNGGPDGGFSIVTNENGAQNGIGNISVEIDALVGVFLDNNQPSLFTPPPPSDFSTQAEQDATPLDPALRQPFFIGTGTSSTDILKQYVVPAGATRLYLGTMDVYKWYDNTGGFTVTVVPEPASLTLLSSGAVICLSNRPRRRAKPLAV